MRIIELEQGSKEWLDWRKSLLTATDAAPVLGISPYTTAYQLWKRKLGLMLELVSTPAMQRGVRDEPIAREMFIKKTGINMKPCCVESDAYNFIGASLDGMSDCGKYILEIKSQRFVDAVPAFHYAQIQHQFMATDYRAKLCYYVSIWDGEIQIHSVDVDALWNEDYLPKAQNFWEKVLLNESPELTNKDYISMDASPMWESFAQEYRKVCEQLKHLETVKESYKKELIKLCGGESSIGAGIKVMKRIVKGRVDYESIPELSSVNLDSYRKPSSESWTIFLEGK